MFERKCKVCGTEFDSKTHNACYCSEECRKIGSRKTGMECYLRERERKKTKKNQGIIDIQKKAREQGLRYADLQIQETLAMIKEGRAR